MRDSECAKYETEKIKFEYDREVDAAYLAPSGGKVTASEQIEPGLIADFGRDDQIIGIEILNFARWFMERTNQQRRSHDSPVCLRV
jgi:uncharacterized protein YuzE